MHELELTGVNAHPFHLHVNSFQIAADPDDTNGDYFKQGDWHDVMITPGDAVTARFQTDRYVGKQVIHCHILEHEDEGMMLVTEITGTDGTLWTGAETAEEHVEWARLGGPVARQHGLLGCRFPAAGCPPRRGGAGQPPGLL